MSGLDGKVAIVTGAGSGIGRGAALALATAGAAVAVTDVDERGGAETLERIRAEGGRGTFLVHDVAEESRWIEVIEAVERELGPLGVLVNNAGIAIAGSVTECTLEDWRRQTAVNLDGVFLGVKHAIPAMRRAGGGSIVNVSSVAGLRGHPRLAGYCATKGGVRLFTKAVALECATAGDPIRVNSVHPGVIDTAIWQTVAPGDLVPGRNAIDPHALAEASVPFGRAGTPVEVARAIVFLASDDASYVSGTELVVDGAQSA